MPNPGFGIGQKPGTHIVGVAPGATGNLAASGTDRDSTSHMDDILNALREITQLLQVTAGAHLVAQSQPVARGSPENV